MNAPFQTPVILLIFNRPAETARALAAIRAVRPSRLFVVADGPRPGHPDDPQACAQARGMVSDIDWPCSVERLEAATNMGCRDRVSSGLDWAFDRVEEAVVIEDDCLSDPSFFQLCGTLLARHRDDPRVMSIGGHRCDGPDEHDPPSYAFSRYPASWGWATWRRAWRHYDVGLREWPRLRATGWLESLLGDASAVRHWRRIFDHAVRGIDTWDYAWVFAHWLHGGLAIRPRVNLVQNIGFGQAATHTRDASHPLASRPAASLSFPLHHPSACTRDEALDRRLEWILFSGMVRRSLIAAQARITAGRRAG
jgi:hypothetical protein